MQVLAFKWSHLYCIIAVKWVTFKDLHDEFCEMDTPCTPIRFIIIQCLVMRCGKPLQSVYLNQGQTSVSVMQI